MAQQIIDIALIFALIFSAIYHFIFYRNLKKIRKLFSKEIDDANEIIDLLEEKYNMIQKIIDKYIEELKS